ncbi:MULTISPECIES: hypothetical protein [Streptomyces]|uniref:hypothetical protein n=1 Tax=Streptomyces TaxID=1883 RepID=UPI00131645C2|nr:MULTISPECIES: hypothetical protein [Streptomyces]QGZ52278.1 hypothetical protein GPZ77_31550 [Streptomyces sp. QHH-9511]GGT86550.1 hypothetical protein GCM10010272_34350 [Streptomyces lateritius]
MDEATLRRQLREAAEAHRPDRARILARVERGMAAAPPEPARLRRSLPRPASPWARTLAVAAAVVGVLILGGLVATTVHRAPAPVATVPAPHPPLQAAGAIDPGSNRWWAQSNITLTVPAPLSALTVELRVALTGGIASTGHWRTLPEQDFTVSVREEGAALVYRWTLKEGRTVPPGRHVFAGQYNHAEGARDVAADSYTVTTTDMLRRQQSLRGDFGAPER